MCEFCLKHGEGEKWYLQAKNYSDDLLSDIQRRKLVEKFFSNPEVLARDVQRIDHLEKAPSFIKDVVGRIITQKMKNDHFGQVVPIEEIEQIFGFVNTIVRVACFCRHVTLGEEKRNCYGISLAANGGKLAEILYGLDDSFLLGPDRAGMETLSKEEAISAFHSHEQDGHCHTVWTFQTPFIGVVCNCDRSDCLTMRTTMSRKIPVLFRAEYVADVNLDECTGCQVCMRLCQFDAIIHDASNKKAVIDQRSCYGCGVCRSVCKKNAIRLVDRAKIPVAADLW
jgi:Pyruvate/2-oxoacid:ferredoxin oxidoreductase delta subunit